MPVRFRLEAPITSALFPPSHIAMVAEKIEGED
jgi:hypothetical protein